MTIVKRKKYINKENEFLDKGTIVVALQDGKESIAPWFIKAETYDSLSEGEKNMDINSLARKYYDDVWALCDDDIEEYLL